MKCLDRLSNLLLPLTPYTGMGAAAPRFANDAFAPAALMQTERCLSQPQQKMLHHQQHSSAHCTARQLTLSNVAFSESGRLHPYPVVWDVPWSPASISRTCVILLHLLCSPSGFSHSHCSASRCNWLPPGDRQQNTDGQLRSEQVGSEACRGCSRKIDMRYNQSINYI